jgi:hypothetical protein
MSTHTNGLTTGCALLLAAGVAGCASAPAQPKAPATAAANQATPTTSSARSSQLLPPPIARAADAGASTGAPASGEDEEDAELVVNRELVARCPVVQLVREHVDEFDPDMVWLAVLESIGECMSDDGPMASESIGVSGDEEHRRVVREVLSSRGIAPARVVAKATAAGATECQGGTNCNKRVEITVIAP